MIGVDLVENEKIKKLLNKEKFVERVYTKNEIEYLEKFKDKLEHYAGFFACKEAVMKALEECKQIGFKDIEICHKENGSPYVVLSGKAKEIFEAGGYKKIEVSISQTKNFATAVAYCE